MPNLAMTHVHFASLHDTALYGVFFCRRKETLAATQRDCEFPESVTRLADNKGHGKSVMLYVLLVDQPRYLLMDL